MLIPLTLLACGRLSCAPHAGPACDDRSGIPVPVQGDCISGTLACGSTVTGHNQGGSRWWGDDFYRRSFCTPLPGPYDGPERIYRLKLPPLTAADLSLDSPCADLDLFAAAWAETGRCPTAAHLVPECEGDPSSGGGRVHLETDERPRTWLVSVDGKAGATGPFQLSVACRSR